MFAIILLKRLQDAGADHCLWPTQFGFRRRRGTQDALFIARRQLERAWAQKDGKVVLLALDWAKAFDSVSPSALAGALLRIGVPQEFVKMIQAIYQDQRFIVRDAGHTSTWHTQEYGISQGCPLSPYLFVLLMSVLLADAKDDLSKRGVNLHKDCIVNDLVYADDTLLIDVDEAVLTTFMNCVGEAGQHYGLSFNWKKLEALPVRTQASIMKPDGENVRTKDSMIYLGGLLSADGRITSEVARRIGQARCDFEGLRKVWSHSVLTVAQKLRIFDACVVSKLLYGLHTGTLNKAERSRVDGFHARCLRIIIKVPPSYESRVSNKVVLERARSSKLSTRLLQQQLLYLGELARRPSNDPVRSSIFLPGTFDPLPVGAQRQGRPRNSWANTALRAAMQIVETTDKFESLMAPTARADNAWRAAVNAYCNSL